MFSWESASLCFKSYTASESVSVLLKGYFKTLCPICLCATHGNQHVAFVHLKNAVKYLLHTVPDNQH